MKPQWKTPLNAADVGKGTFFNYFPSKDPILAAFGQLQIENCKYAADAALCHHSSRSGFLSQFGLGRNLRAGPNPAMVRVLVQANLSSEPVRKTMREIHLEGHSGLLARIVKKWAKIAWEIRKDLHALQIAQTLRQASARRVTDLVAVRRRFAGKSHRNGNRCSLEWTRCWNRIFACRALVGKKEIEMKRKLPILLLVVACLVGAAGYSAGWFRHDSALQSSGTVEARNIRVGSKIGGRIDQVLVREGDTVEPGQVLITFDDKELKAALAESLCSRGKISAGISVRKRLRKHGPPPRRPRRNTTNAKTVTGRKILTLRRRIWTALRPMKRAPRWIINVMKL